MTTPRIPLELQELVIDLLDDWNPGIVTVPETLWSCTLTCRAWLPRSRRRLYHSLDFNNIPRTVLNQLVELIDREQEVSSMVQNLRIGERPDEEGDEDDDEEKAKDQRAEEVEDEENDDKGEYDEEDRNDGDHWYLMEQQDQRETRPVKDIIRTGAVLLILARKLPRLASLMISGAVMASPARLPVLAGFPALATLELSHVTISGYGAFQRMLAAAPGLRRLHPPPGEQRDFAFLAHLIRNLHVCGSLEYLFLPNFDIATIITSVISNRFPDLFILRNFSQLRLRTFFQESAAQDKLSGSLESIIRLLTTLWPSEIHAQRRRVLTLELHYPRGTLIPVTNADSGQTSLNLSDDILERLLWALKDVSAELEHVFATINGAGRTVEFLFTDTDKFADQQDVSEIAEMRRAFIVSLRSRVARIFPELHRRGMLSVKFQSRINIDLDGYYYDWVEANNGNFEGIPYRFSSFE